MSEVSMVKIKVWSTDVDRLNEFILKIVDVAKRSGIKVKGPIPLPTKRLVVPTLKLPHGEGRKKWEHWEMRIHKRVIYVAADERVMRQLIRIRVPPEIWMEAEIVRQR